MTRAEFVRAYAANSGLSSEWAVLGLIDVGSRKLIAMPCGCGDETCQGWAMLSSESVLDHLQLYAPAALRLAYNKAVRRRGG